MKLTGRNTQFLQVIFGANRLSNAIGRYQSRFFELGAVAEDSRVWWLERGVGFG